MSQSRQLAAIMFTDIVGYTVLMGKDSAKALELVRISKEIQKPLVRKFHGQWLKEMEERGKLEFMIGVLSEIFYFNTFINCSFKYGFSFPTCVLFKMPTVSNSFK